jgi:hypothetical protein
MFPFANPLTGRLIAPQFKVLRPVIVSDTINVMNRLVRLQGPTKYFFHHYPVLEHIFTLRATANYRMVIGRVDKDVSLALYPATLPLMILGA